MNLNADVLVLNKGWTPIHTENIKDAIGRVFTDIVEIVEHSDIDIPCGDMVSTSHTTYNWAEWVSMSKYAVPFLRKEAALLRNEAARLREASLVEPEYAKDYISQAEELEAKSVAISPKVIRLANGNEVRVPEVVRHVKYNGVPDLEIKLTRKNLLLRDNFTCQYCGKKVGAHNFSIDHIIPKSRGGRGSWENYVIACVRCNRSKDARTPAEAGLRLLSKPTKPKWHPLSARFSTKSSVSWRKFLPSSALTNSPNVNHGEDVEKLAKRKKK